MFSKFIYFRINSNASILNLIEQVRLCIRNTLTSFLISGTQINLSFDILKHPKVNSATFFADGTALS